MKPDERVCFQFLFDKQNKAGWTTMHFPKKYKKYAKNIDWLEGPHEKGILVYGTANAVKVKLLFDDKVWMTREDFLTLYDMFKENL